MHSASARGTSSLSTDRNDYMPGDTVQISGCGFLGNEPVSVQVIHLDSARTTVYTAYALHDPWQVVADSNGNISTRWFVSQDCLGATLKAMAQSITGAWASVTFTDGARCGMHPGASEERTSTARNRLNVPTGSADGNRITAGSVSAFVRR